MKKIGIILMILVMMTACTTEPKEEEKIYKNNVDRCRNKKHTV